MTVKATIFTCDCCGEDFEGEVSPYWPSDKNYCTFRTRDKVITLIYTKIDLSDKDAHDYDVDLKKYDYADLCPTCTETITRALWENWIHNEDNAK